MEKKRSNYIDLVKGLSILTLFFLHFENGWMDAKYNYFLVRSPSFYIVVGWLWGLSSNKRSIKEHWNKRKNGLVKPYLWFSLLFLCFNLFLCFFGLVEPSAIYRDIYKTLCLRGIGTLWFLPALLGGEILFLLVRDRKLFVRYLFYILCFGVICSYTFWFSIYVGNNKDLLNAPYRVIRDICDCFLYLSIAYYISRAYGRKIINSSPKFLLLLNGSVFLLIDFLLINFCRFDNIVYDSAIFLICNLFAGLGIIMFFKPIENLSIFDPILYCGKNTLIIMAVHYSILFQIALLFHKTYFDQSYSGSVTLVYFIIAIVLQVIIVEVINRKFPFLIGKVNRNAVH